MILLRLASILLTLPALGGCVTAAQVSCTKMPDGHLSCGADADWNTVGM
jgi:hypothetical protein